MIWETWAGPEVGVSLGLTHGMWFGLGKNPKVQGKEGFGVGVSKAKAVLNWGGHLRWPE